MLGARTGGLSPDSHSWTGPFLTLSRPDAGLTFLERMPLPFLSQLPQRSGFMCAHLFILTGAFSASSFQVWADPFLPIAEALQWELCRWQAGTQKTISNNSCYPLTTRLAIHFLRQQMFIEHLLCATRAGRQGAAGSRVRPWFSVTGVESLLGAVWMEGDRQGAVTPAGLNLIPRA